MSVRKRKWVTSKGVQREAWLVDYSDQHGKRHAKTFSKKKDADAFASTTHVEVRNNIHVADSDTITVSAAGELWLARARKELERGTFVQYRQHLRLHIEPLIGNTKLTRVTVPFVRKFLDDLHDAGLSPAMVKAVRTSLGAIIAEAQDRGYSIRNAVREMSSRRTSTRVEKRHKRKLQYGVDIPTHEEVRLIIEAAEGRFRALILTAIFTGLRSSELRGLRWDDVDLVKKQLHVRQRADVYNAIGSPKSASSQRMIPLSPIVVNTLREWKVQCPRGDLNLVFPTSRGTVMEHGNIIRDGLIPTLIRAGVTVETGRLDSEGKPILAAKYTGLHALRHWFASWCINSTKDRGLGLPAKSVQDRLGHSTIVLTLDTYGHLFPAQDEDTALAEAERALMSPVSSAT